MRARIGRLSGTLMGLISLLVVGCGGGPVSINGRVLDQKGAPVTKAEVSTDPETDIVLTNSRGFFNLRAITATETGEIEPIKPGVYRITVKKFGFEELIVEVKVAGGPSRVPDLVMQPRTPDIGEAAPDPTQEREVAPEETSPPVGGI